MTKPTPPLPLFLRVQEIAQRWGVDSNYVMKFYFDGSANFLYGAFSDRLQPYDHREILAAAGEDPRTGQNNIMEQMRFARDDLPKLEASMVWLSREEVLRLESQSDTSASLNVSTVKGEATPAQSGWNIRELTQERSEEWLRKPCWSIGEVHWLLNGFDPVSKLATDFPPPANAGEDVDRMNRAILAGQLVPISHDKHGEPVYTPADVIRVAESLDFGCWAIWKNLQPPAPVAKVESAKSATQAKAGITKQKVINAFKGMHYNRDKWGKYLGDPPKWLEECRLARGSKKASATWSPVLIAIALLDKNIQIAKLDAVFVGLKDWADEWKEKSEVFR